MEPKRPIEEEKDGVWQDSDSFESNPEFFDMLEDVAYETLSPEYLEILKRFSPDVDETTVEED